MNGRMLLTPPTEDECNDAKKCMKSAYSLLKIMIDETCEPYFEDCEKSVAEEILKFLSAVQCDQKNGLIWRAGYNDQSWSDDSLASYLAAMFYLKTYHEPSKTYRSEVSRLFQTYRIAEPSLHVVIHTALTYLKVRAFELGGPALFEKHKVTPSYFSMIATCGFFHVTQEDLVICDGKKHSMCVIL